MHFRVLSTIQAVCLVLPTLTPRAGAAPALRGSPDSEGSAGARRLISPPIRPTPTPTQGCAVSEVYLQTLNWGSEIAWTIAHYGTNNVVCSGHGYSSNEEYIESCCLVAGWYTLRCLDSARDGWHGASLEIGGRSYCGHFNHGHLVFMSVHVMTPEQSTATAHSTTETRTETTTTTPHTTTETTPVCADHVPLGEDHWYDIYGDDCSWYEGLGPRCLLVGHAWGKFGMTANEACCVCGGGVRMPTQAPAPTPESNCAVSEVLLHTAYFGHELSWHIVSSDDPDRVACSGSGYENFDSYTIPCCLPGGSYHVLCADSHGDGWHGASLTIDGVSYCSHFLHGYLKAWHLIADTSTTTAHSTTVTATDTSTTSPHSTTETTPLCADAVPDGHDRWVDYAGDDCSWYEELGPRCLVFGHWWRNFDMTASEACCACGGGVGAPTPAPAPTPESKCAVSEVVLRTMSYGYEIAWEIVSDGDQNDVKCSGMNYDSFSDYTIACCLPEGSYYVSCADSDGDGWHGASLTIGGEKLCGDFFHGHLTFASLTAVPTSTTDHSTTQTTTDITTISLHTTTATIPLCVDHIPAREDHWYDTYGDTCAWYEDHALRCLVEGHSARMFGMTANEACCVCGGGSRVPAAAPAPTPDSSCAVREVVLQTRRYGHEISWQIVPSGEGDNVVCSGSNYMPFNQAATPCCLPAGSYQVYCGDSQGDGWHGAFLTIGGVSYCRSFSHGHLQVESLIAESTSITPHTTTATTAETTTTTPHTTTGTVPMCTDYVPHGEHQWYDQAGDGCSWYEELRPRCLVVGHDGENFGKVANEACCVCGGGVRVATPAPAPTPASNCAVGELILQTQEWGQELAWQIVPLGEQGMVLCSGGNYEDNRQYDIACCLPAGAYYLQCADSFGDGWHGASLSIGGVSYCDQFSTGYLKAVLVKLDGVP